MQQQKLTSKGLQLITQEIFLKFKTFSFNKNIIHLRSHTHTTKRFSRDILDV